MVTVGIIGDFSLEAEPHRATDEALHHAAHALGITAEVSDISSYKFTDQELDPSRS